MNKNWSFNYISLKDYFKSKKVNEIYKVYTFIANYIIQNPTRKFFFSFQKMANFLNMPYQTIYSAVKRLAKDELIEIIEGNQVVKYKGNEFKIYREIKVKWAKAKLIMSILSLNCKAYKSLEKRRYRKLAKQRAFTYIAKSQVIYKEYMEECGYNKYKNFKQMYLEYCKNVSNKYYDVTKNLNYISLEEVNMHNEEEKRILKVLDIDPPNRKNEDIKQLMDHFRQEETFKISHPIITNLSEIDNSDRIIREIITDNNLTKDSHQELDLEFQQIMANFSKNKL